MQTDIFLQKALVDEVKDVLKGYTTLNNGEPVKFNVYPQNLPAKKGKNDEDHFPYVLVCLDEEVIQAAKMSHSWEFIRRLPNGLDTILYEDSLSQGQKQLLCITRVMLCLPPMLILDEATSSIDTRTEMLIQEAFDRMNFFEKTAYAGVRYGTRKEDIQTLLDQGKFAVIPVDMCGAIAMKRSFPTHIIYVARDKEKLIADIIDSDYDTEEKTLRILSIDAEKRNRKICDYVIHNDTIEGERVSGAEEIRRLILLEGEKY